MGRTINKVGVQASSLPDSDHDVVDECADDNYQTRRADEDVEITRIRVRHTTDDYRMTVRWCLTSDGVESLGCSWPATWGDEQYAGDEFGHGETISDDELASRKSEAIESTRPAVEQLFGGGE